MENYDIRCVNVNGDEYVSVDDIVAYIREGQEHANQTGLTAAERVLEIMADRIESLK